MKQNQLKLRKCLLILLLAAMTVQIVLGFAWMAVNLTNMPLFGDSTEYYELSQTLQVDEYRPLLYPLIIRIANKIANHMSIPYQTLVYSGQTLLCILSVFFLAEQLGGIIFSVQKRKNQKQFHLAVFFFQPVCYLHSDDHFYEFFYTYRFNRNINVALDDWCVDPNFSCVRYRLEKLSFDRGVHAGGIYNSCG